MLSSVTISLVPETKGGPFVFWDDVAAGCTEAKKLGFDAVEIFAPGPEELKKTNALKIVQDHGLKLAALGTGGAWVRHQWTLTSPDSQIRSKALDFVKSMMDAGAPAGAGAGAIIGSLQGRHGNGVSPEQAHGFLQEAIATLAVHARAIGVPLLFEPLNRYETNLIRTVEEGLDLVKKSNADGWVKLLCDLFHMNIEEIEIEAALRRAGHAVGHVHLADSNRRPAGYGHTNFATIARALKEIGYQGYVSAEALPWPDSTQAARQTIACFRAHFQQ